MLLLTLWLLIIIPKQTIAENQPQNQAKERECLEVGGVYTTESCFCPALNRFINLNQESEKQECHNKFAEEQVKNLESINSIDIIDKTCENLYQERSSHFGCPSILKSLLFQDKEGSHLRVVPSPVANCETETEISPSGLETEINSSNFIESFTPPGLVSSEACLARTEGGGGGRRSGKGWQNRIGREEVTLKDKTRFVADYYYSIKRLERGMEQTLTKIASLNEMTEGEGKPMLPNEVLCDSYELPALMEKCENLKQCQAPGNTLDVAEQSIQAIQAIKLLEEKRTSVRSQMALKTDQYIEETRPSAWSNGQTPQTKEASSELSGELKSLSDQEKILNSKIEMTYQLYPWIKGNKFKSGFSELLEEEKESPQKVASLLKEQAEATKLELINNLKEQKQALKCLNSQVYEPEKCKNALELISKSPKLDDIESIDNNLSASSLSALKAAKCRAEVRDKKESANDFIEGLALDALLLAGTLGLTGIALGGKAAVNVAKLLSLGKKTKPTKAMLYSLLGVEVLAGMDHARDALEECSENLNRLEDSTHSLNNKSTSCSEEIRETSTLKANYKACLMKTALVSLPFALPGALALTRTLKNTSQRIWDQQRLRRLATASLGKNLNNDEVRAIYRAHQVGEARRRSLEAGGPARNSSYGYTGSEFRYTRSELRRKLNILKEAGFILEQRRRLVEEGVVGSNPESNREREVREQLETQRDTSLFNINRLYNRNEQQFKNLGIEQSQLLNDLARLNITDEESHRVMILPKQVNNIGRTRRKFPIENVPELRELMNKLRKKGEALRREDLPVGVNMPNRGFKFTGRDVYHAHIDGTKYVVCWQKDQNDTIQITYIGQHPNNNDYSRTCREVKF